MNIGENIRRIREEKGILQVELAERVGVSQAMVCQLERGTKVPTLPLSVEIAKALGCGISDFLDSKGEMKR